VFSNGSAGGRGRLLPRYIGGNGNTVEAKEIFLRTNLSEKRFKYNVNLASTAMEMDIINFTIGIKPIDRDADLLIKVNHKFDLLLFPNTSYMMYPISVRYTLSNVKSRQTL
jgi:hypothetical protein